MADVITYSASLTNSVGKTFDRETIVVGFKSKQNQAPSGKTTQFNGFKQKPGKDGKHSGLLQAQKLSDQKAQAKLNDTLNLWHGKLRESLKCQETNRSLS
jgi:hypothetical protein